MGMSSWQAFWLNILYYEVHFDEHAVYVLHLMVVWSCFLCDFVGMYCDG